MEPTTLEQITDILGEHGGLESNISPFHCYWDLVRQYRSGTDHAALCVFNPAPLNAPIPVQQIQDTVKLGILRAQNRNTLATFSMESNIPYTHAYWFNKNVISAIERQPE